MHGRAPRWHRRRAIRCAGHCLSPPAPWPEVRPRGARPCRAVLPGQPHSSEDAVSDRRIVRGGQGMRPKTLAEVARLALTGDAFDRCLANFLDEFYAAPAAAALAESPPLLAPSRGELGRVQDAYLAATAEELARQYNLAL